MIGKIAFALFVLAFIALQLSKFMGKADPAAVHKLVEGGALLVDVRSPAEFAGGHLDGAKSIPVGELEARISELGAKDRDIVVYCASGARSGSAKRALESAGFTSVHDLGAMSRW